MENGGLGEARARAFLLERFWVLERSVDIDGADFLIQRRLERNFLDKNPPRLGIVQVKFIQDCNTSITIRKSYFFNKDNEIFNEFFLLVFTGMEDSARSYLLSAKDIFENFAKKETPQGVVFSISGLRLFAKESLFIKFQKRALDRIERALINAEFISNRSFLSETDFFSIGREEILPELNIPVHNSYGNIPEAFYGEKKKVQRTALDMEEVLEALREISRSTDPIEAMRLYEDVVSMHISGKSLVFNGDFFNDSSFFDGINEHYERLKVLKERGLTSLYTILINEFKETVCDRLIEIGVRKGYVQVDVQFAPNSLANPRVIVSEVTYNDDHSAMTSPGNIRFNMSLNSIFWPNDNRSIPEIVRDRAFSFVAPFQRELDILLFKDSRR